MRATMPRRAPTCAALSNDPETAASAVRDRAGTATGGMTRRTMSEPVSRPDDPRPQPPQAPAPEDCCNSGCPLCIYDLYNEEVERYRAALEAWRLRHPDADDAR